MPERIIIKNGHIVDPSQDIDGPGDILIEDGLIKALGNGAAGPGAFRGKVINASGMLVLPGLVDIHTHLREPGFEHKETIRTGTIAAVMGGFTSICCMPNTNPVNDNATVTTFIIKRAKKEGACKVYPVGSVTKGQDGEELAEFGMMYESGCIAFSDDGRPVTGSLVMRRALEYSRIFGVPIISHCEDLSLADDGVMNEGETSALLGLRGIPSASEEVMVSRDIILAGLTGGRLHIAHVSTKGAVELIRNAKAKGINVTAETCPHYFTITEGAVAGYNTNAKVNPPLRTLKDVEAIRDGLRDGTLDVIATDHAPHHKDEKLREFDKAPFGISGLETALGLSLRLVTDGVLSMGQLVRKMALNPSRIMGMEAGSLKPGAEADVVIVDPEKEYTVDAERFQSRGKNTPFDGWTLKGMPVLTLMQGKVFE
jgi:dihydroorotase